MSSLISLIHKQFFVTAPSVQEICQPLFDHYALDFFMYIRFLPDKSSYGVMSNPRWSDCAIKKNIILDPPMLPKGLKKFSFFALWQSAVPQWIEQEINQLSIYYPLSYFDITQKYCDFYTFGMHKESSVGINNYLNNLDILKKFSIFFREKSRALLKSVEKNKFKAPPYLRTAINPSHFPHLAKAKKENFKINYELLSNVLNISITKQEYNCLKAISGGKTAKECAHMMNLSSKTFENYIYNLKNKLGINRKSQLIDIYQTLLLKKEYTF